jgi:DNA-binding MarR family transcriptional regulator
MTETRTSPPAPLSIPIGQAVGMAETALSRLLAGVLAETGTSRPTYLALQRMAALGDHATRDQYVADLAEWLDLDQPRAGELADSLVASELLTVTDTAVRLSDTGAGLRARILNSVGTVTAGLYEPFDPADLETTVSTLLRITKRARELR